MNCPQNAFYNKSEPTTGNDTEVVVFFLKKHPMIPDTSALMRDAFGWWNNSLYKEYFKNKTEMMESSSNVGSITKICVRVVMMCRLLVVLVMLFSIPMVRITFK